MIIGILAIQGDFELHQKVLYGIRTDNILVKTPQDLNKCNGLIIPGGESTTFVKLMKVNNLFNSVIAFGQNKAIMGTCAGLIILAKKVHNLEHETLKLIDIEVSRNAYGRQIDSFIDHIELSINNNKSLFEGVFIRAPKIVKIGEGARSLGFHKNDVVLAENENILAATFHPELTEDTRIHEYFVTKVQKLIK